MATTPHSERRQHPRELLNAGVTFYIESADASFHARTIDISKGGLLMLAGPSVPAKIGQAVKIGSDHERLSEFQSYGNQCSAQVVRVSRGNLLKTGQIEVAVKFC